MCIVPLFTYCPRSWAELPLAPLKAVLGIFLETLGCLLEFLKAADFGKSLKDKGARLLMGSEAVFGGFWFYGGRFLVPSNNYEACCRGMCYAFIDSYLHPLQKTIEDIADGFIQGPSERVIEMHRENQIPATLAERRIWTYETALDMPEMPDLDQGIYTILIGFSRDANHPGKGHRVVLIQGPVSYLFDPNTGLSIWSHADWKPLLERICSNLRDFSSGYFTIECYAYNAI